MTFRDIANLALRPFSVAIGRRGNLVLRGHIDEVRAAVRLARMLPITGADILGRGQASDASCAFLREVPTIRDLRLVAAGLADIEAVQGLDGLQRIAIVRVAEGQSIQLDLSAFRSLEHAEIEWFDGADSIFRSRTLRSLALSYCPLRRSDALRGLTNLVTLRLSGGRLQETAALRELCCLRWLALLAEKKLEDFSGLSAHPAIKFLWIEDCRHLATMEWLDGMAALETLRILDCGSIVDFGTLSSLMELRHVHIHGDVKISFPDTNFLRAMPHMEHVFVKGLPATEAKFWANRNKHYRLLRDDL
jgi:hypothetical protein